MVGGVRRFGRLRLGPDARVRLADHLFAEVHADQVILKDVVVEHILGCLAEIDDPLTEGRRSYAERHILGIAGTGRVIVTTNTANTAGNEMSVARVLAFHEDAIATEDRGGAMALDHALIIEVDLGIDAEAADDACDRIPGHLDQILGIGPNTCFRSCRNRHGRRSFAYVLL